MTPEEKKWRESAYNPAKAEKHLRFLYIMLAIWIVLSIVWVVIILCDGEKFSWENHSWSTPFLLVVGFVNAGMAIYNNKRLLKQAKTDRTEEKS